LIYFQPDPKFHFVHGSYGLQLKKEFSGEDWIKNLDKSISLKKAMKLCDNPAENSGTRVDPIDYTHQTMIADFFLTYVRNKKGAINLMKRTYKEFVINGDKGYVGNNESNVPNRKIREEIWESSIKEGMKMVKIEEERDIEKNKRSV
jgi:hypothetical protein